MSAFSTKVASLLRNPGFDSANGVTIIDFFGRSMVLPLDFCESWDVSIVSAIFPFQ